MAKRISDSRIEAIMKRSVSDALDGWKQSQRKPVKGNQLDLYNFGSPKARWRQHVFKYGPLYPTSSIVTTFDDAIPATANAHIKIEGITLYISGALSASVYVDKIGIPTNHHHADANYYFYTSSMHSGNQHNNTGINYLSGSGSSVLCHQARASTHQYSSSHLINGGYFTASTDITVRYNATPDTAVGSIYLYVYADKFYKSWE